jgi:hypothetical protein
MERAFNGENGHNGVINPIFYLTDDLNNEYVFRLANPHPYWKGKPSHEYKLMEIARNIGMLESYIYLYLPILSSYFIFLFYLHILIFLILLT